jgi:hypothetical protein
MLKIIIIGMSHCLESKLKFELLCIILKIISSRFLFLVNLNYKNAFVRLHYKPIWDVTSTTLKHLKVSGFGLYDQQKVAN